MDRLGRFAWAVLGYNVLVVLWGAVVRATGSGAGCGSHWPLCNGEVVPRAETVATLIEFSHRATSGIALLLVVALTSRVFRGRPAGHPARAAAGWSMAFMAGEAAVGAMLVLFELVAENRSLGRALFMGTHLLNTFFLLGALTLTARFLDEAPRPRFAGRHRQAALLAIAAFAVLLTSTSGAVAALGDTLFPSLTLEDALRADLRTTSHLLIRLRVLHPFLAVATGLLLLVVSYGMLSGPDRSGAGRSGRVVAALTMSQLGFGALNVLLLAPIWMQVAHLLLADLLWIALVVLALERLGASAREPRPAPAVSLAGLPSEVP
jgi:cytochrome c oxidase assembly protein subunit 15